MGSRVVSVNDLRELASLGIEYGETFLRERNNDDAQNHSDTQEHPNQGTTSSIKRLSLHNLFKGTEADV